MSEASKSLVKVFAVILQNNQGVRFYAKYYLKHFHKSVYTVEGQDLSQVQYQRVFEKALLNKAKRMEVLGTMKPEDIEIFNYSHFVVLFKIINELQIYVVADEDENEVLLADLLTCIQNVLQFVTKNPLTGTLIYDILQEIILTIDEMLDEGIPVNLQADAIASRIKLKQQGHGNSPTTANSSSAAASNTAASTFSNLFGFAKNSLQKTLNLG